MKFDLNENEVNVVLRALQEMPYKMVANVLAKISAQLNQNEPEPEDKSKNKKKDKKK